MPNLTNKKMNRFTLSCVNDNNQDPKHKFRTPRQQRILNEKLLSLPDTTVFPSNHVMINKERVERNLHLLERCRILDDIAKYHVNSMSKQEQLIQQLDEKSMSKLEESYSTNNLGLNVCRGTNIWDIQKKLMKSSTDKQNILNEDFDNMGFATSKSSKGQLYVCQVFVHCSSSDQKQGNSTGSIT